MFSQDIAERVGKTFPNPIESWALREARETIDKSKKKKPVLPVDRIHLMLCKVRQTIFICILQLIYFALLGCITI